MFMSKSMNLKINKVHQKITTRPNLQDYKQKRPKAYPSNPPVEKHWFRAYFLTGGSRPTYWSRLLTLGCQNPSFHCLMGRQIVFYTVFVGRKLPKVENHWFRGSLLDSK